MRALAIVAALLLAPTWSNGGVRPAGEPIVTVWDVEFFPTRMPLSWDLTGQPGEPDAVMRRCLLAEGDDPGPGQENLGCVVPSP